MFNYLVKNGYSWDRIALEGIEHPDGIHVLVRYMLKYISNNGTHGCYLGWAKKENIVSASYFRQFSLKDNKPNFPSVQSNCYSAEYLTDNGFAIPLNIPIDEWGYCYLTKEQEEQFWTLVKKNHEKERLKREKKTKEEQEKLAKRLKQSPKNWAD